MNRPHVLRRATVMTALALLATGLASAQSAPMTTQRCHVGALNTQPKPQTAAHSIKTRLIRAPSSRIHHYLLWYPPVPLPHESPLASRVL